jgi:hypothetical protein
MVIYPRKIFSTNTAVIDGLSVAALSGYCEPQKSDLLLGFFTPSETAVSSNRGY